MPEKRAASESAVALMPVKRKKNEIVAADSINKSLIEAGVQRTSSLQSPIMLLSGQPSEIFCTKFHPEGHYLASGGFDRQIYLWNVYGECENFAVMSGHTGAIMDMHFNTDGSVLATASTDKTVCLWDCEVGVRVKKLKGHTTFVNACHLARRGPQLLCSASDDCTIKLWDTRKRVAVATLQNTYQVCALTFNDTAEQIISGGIDNDIKIWDLRKVQVVNKLRGHTDTVTGLSLSPDGSYLLSNAMDNSLRIWDVRPYAPGDRCLKTLIGHQHSFEKNLLRCAWSPTGSHVSAGSADRFVYVWDTASRRITYKLPGHNGSVNDIDFHPSEPIIMSGGSDKQIYLGEIEI